MIKNALTIDVEDWFHVCDTAVRGKVSDWSRYEGMVAGNTSRILDVLKKTGTYATFFVLGWVAEMYPELVERIAAEDHEVASHGYSHAPLNEMTQKEFREDLHKSIEIIESIIGKKVLGYRAPGFWTADWLFDVLVSMGLKYDASILPGTLLDGAVAGAPMDPYPLKRDGKILWEFPYSTLKLFNSHIPMFGGGYLRLCPYWVVKRGIKKINSLGRPVMIYIHPREIGKYHPDIALRGIERIKYFINLKPNRWKIMSLLNDFKFTTASDVLNLDSGSDCIMPRENWTGVKV